LGFHFKILILAERKKNCTAWLLNLLLAFKDSPRLTCINPLKPSGHYMYHRFNIQQFHVLPTQCIYVLCGSQNKQWLFPYTTLTDWFV